LKKINILIPLVIFSIAFMFVPFSQLDYLQRMPGDIGDARLNNYFLENIYQFIIGRSNSLWHLSFFSPFPYVLGFSDNLFGSSPIYIITRIFTADTSFAYQIWFLFGYLVNFISAYYVLRRLNGSVLAASIGALIFTFALPTTAHAGHAQLHYRFGIPLAIVFFIDFIITKSWRYLLIAFAWLVWQFYAGIYMGFFTFLLMLSMIFGYLVLEVIVNKIAITDLSKKYLASWRGQSSKQKTIFILGFFGLLIFLLILFYPYLQVSKLYNLSRSWGEISTMLPRPQSFFLSDASFFWTPKDSHIFNNLPMRHEHQMFIGMVPLLLALLGFLFGSRKVNGLQYSLICSALFIPIFLTIYIGGYSLWFFVHKFPLFSAIRAIARLDQVLLLVASYFAVIALDKIKGKYLWGEKAILIIILPLVILEAGFTSMSTSPKSDWDSRLVTIEKAVPKNLPADAILFFAQKTVPFYASEIDAMNISLKYQRDTINGYSGDHPKGFRSEYGDDCAEIPRRVLSYMSFIERPNDLVIYRSLMSKIIPIGFNDCQESWLEKPPSLTYSNKIYTSEDIKSLNYASFKLTKTHENIRLHFDIQNTADFPFSANSLLDKPIRISWRYIGDDGIPMSGWDSRLDLPFDIPAKGKLHVSLMLDNEKASKSKKVEVTLVQELVFWAHDVGLQAVAIDLNN
jgi:hypothetical protein